MRIGNESGGATLEQEEFPREAEMILSAMEAGAPRHPDRRYDSRKSYRTRASLQLYAEPADAPPRILYTRDIDQRSVGFITPSLLPLGYGGWITLVGPNGEEVSVECTVYRCRKTVSGWHEGAVRFNRAVWQFE